MYCPHCGAAISEDSLFCEHCGARQESPLRDDPLRGSGRACPECGAPMEDSAASCEVCGYETRVERIDGISPPSPSRPVFAPGFSRVVKRGSLPRKKAHRNTARRAGIIAAKCICVFMILTGVAIGLWYCASEGWLGDWAENITTPKSELLSEAYAAYYAVLQSAMDELGIISVGLGPFEYWVYDYDIETATSTYKTEEGICYAEILDFGNGELPMLLYTYTQLDEYGFLNREERAYLYSEVEQKAKLCFSGITYSEPGPDHNGLSVVMTDSGIYLRDWSRDWSSDEWVDEATYYTIQNNIWTEALDIQQGWWPDMDAGSWYISRDEVTEAEYDAAIEKMGRVVNEHEIPMNTETIFSVLDELSRIGGVLPTQAAATATSKPASDWNETGRFAAGNGTESSPWIILTAQQFSNIRDELDGHFLLGENIDLDNETFEPIGTGGYIGDAWSAAGGFNGVLDGNGYTIDAADDDGGDYQSALFSVPGKCGGLFASIGKDGVVKNLFVKGMFYEGSDNDFLDISMGAITGYNLGLIEGCNVRTCIQPDRNDKVIKWKSKDLGQETIQVI